MKKFFNKVLVLLIAAFMLSTACGCSLFAGQTNDLPKISAPRVSVSVDGVATWDKPTDTLYFAYVINDGDEKITAEQSVQLAEGDTLKVKAISSSSQYDDSDFSQAVTYRKGAESLKLATPQVSVDADGLASWGKITNAEYYVYVIGSGSEKKTTGLNVQLSENETIKVKACSDSVDYESSDFSQSVTYVKGSVQTKLATPHVSVDADGLASWSKITNAEYYIYVIGSGAEKRTTGLSVQLSENETIKVKACSDSINYKSSDFSQPVTYVKSSVQIKLATPQVSVDTDGLASWGKVANAEYYIYVIGSGAEKRTTGLSVRLSENETIKVKACSDSVDYESGDFSQPVTYVKSGQTTHTHTDNNSDGYCDTCNKSVKAELSFYAINDLHGKYMDTSNQPGLDEFTTYIKNQYKDTSREEILLSSGDMWQGTVESSSNKGKLMTEWMNEVGFVSMTLGNHEYDWGSSVLDPNSELAEFPFLAINVTYNNKPVNYCRGSTVIERGGIKIGIIGAIGDCLSSISGDFQTGLKFATGSALTALVKAESVRLKKEEGCKLIVYSIHEGYESSLSGITDVSGSDISYYDTSLSDGYVDLVFEAHTHQHYILRDEYGVYHIQGGGENNYVSLANVSYNTVTDKFSVDPVLLGRTVYANSSLKGDAVVKEIFDKYFPDNNPYTTVLGKNSSKKDGDTICETVARLYYEKGVAEWGKQYSIVLGGGFLQTRSPYSIAAGNVNYASLFSVLPFDNDIVLGKIRGSNLKSKFLQNSRYKIYATISESEVVDSNYYYIVVDSYTSSYKSNNITEVTRLKDGKYARDLLADFVSSGGWN